MLATLHAQAESSDTAEMAETQTLGVICRVPTNFLAIQATQARDWSLVL